MSHEDAPRRATPSAAPLPFSPPSFLPSPQGSIFDSPDKTTSSFPPRPSTAPLTTAAFSAAQLSNIARGPISSMREATHASFISETPPMREATHAGGRTPMGQTMAGHTMVTDVPRPSTAPGVTTQDVEPMQPGSSMDQSLMDALEQEIASPIPLQHPYLEAVNNPVPTTSPQVFTPQEFPSSYGPVQNAVSNVSYAPMGFSQSERPISPYMDMRSAMPSTPLTGMQPTPPPQTHANHPVSPCTHAPPPRSLPIPGRILHA